MHALAGDIAVDERFGEPLGDDRGCIEVGEPQGDGQPDRLAAGIHVDPRTDTADLIAGAFDERARGLEASGCEGPGIRYLPLFVLAQHIHRTNQDGSAPAGEGKLETAGLEPDPRVWCEGCLARADRGELFTRPRDALGVDLDADDLHIGADARQPRPEFQRCDGACPESQIDDERIVGPAQRGQPREVPVVAAQPVRACRPACRLPDGATRRRLVCGRALRGHPSMMSGMRFTRRRYHGRMTEPYTLILLRHGQSEWNELNLFTGWVDVRLTDLGKAEAKRGGELLAEAGLLPDVLHTSVLSRAIQTANIALDAADRLWIPVTRTWRLNERHYGALQGKDKAQTLAEFGPEQFMLWRRSFDVPPPEIADDDEFSQVSDPRYVGIDGEIPRTESLKLVIDRMLPYWESGIVPDLRAGKTVLVTAHGNSLRGLVKHLEGISDDDISELNIPTGIPLVYRLGEDLLPLGPGEYLDPEAAAAGAAAVAAQGKK